MKNLVKIFILFFVVASTACNENNVTEPTPEPGEVSFSFDNGEQENGRKAGRVGLLTSNNMSIVGFIPEGSYKLTCRNLSVELSCQAENGSGSNLPASLDLTNLVNPDVWNEFGVLRVTNNSSPQDGFQPGGSWKLSCSNISVVLNCEAQKVDGSWVAASYDLTDLNNASLWNDNGVLRE